MIFCFLIGFSLGEKNVIHIAMIYNETIRNMLKHDIFAQYHPVAGIGIDVFTCLYLVA